MSEPFKPYKVDTELNKLKIPNTGARFMRTFAEVSPEDSSVKINIRVYLSSVSTLIEEYLGDETHEKIVRNRRNDKDRANFFGFQNPNDQLMGGLYMHIRVSEGLPNTDINFSGEIQNGEFYDIDELLVEENSKLGSATRNILEYIQSSRQSILKIAGEFNELRNTLSDKWGIVDKKRKETITDLIDSIPGIENFSGNEGGRLADLFLSWEGEYLSEKNSIYELLRLGAQVGKIKIISQVIEASDVDQMSRIYNPLRFQVL